MSKPIPKVDSTETFRTTNTMREKAKIISRCVVNILKMFRVCCKEKKHKENNTIQLK